MRLAKQYGQQKQFKNLVGEDLAGVSLLNIQE